MCDVTHMTTADGREIVVISKAKFDQMTKNIEFLVVLKSHGVDNWAGYSDAFRDAYGDEDDEEDC